MSDIRAEDALWKQQIQKIGAGPAYEELVRASAQLSSGEQHTRAHVFGGALYETEGLQGLAVCDDRLFSGCFHEFLGRAILDLGIGGVSKLNDVCLDVLGSPRNAVTCQHGIGHGVLAYYGYTTDALKKALAVCAGLKTIDETRGCEGGVFMEDNLKTMAGSYVIPTFSEGDLLGTCGNIPPTFRQSCVFWLPQLWQLSMTATTSPDVTTVFKKMGAYCERMTSSSTLSTDCFAGIGYIAGPSAEFDTVRTMQLCSDTSVIPEHRVSCWLTALQGSVQEPKSGGAQYLCAGLAAAAVDRCNTLVAQHGDSESGIPAVLP